jgi:excisionase family DNA binding protein
MWSPVELLSRTEAARRLGVSLLTLDREIRRGALAATRIGRRVLVPAEALVDLTGRGAVNEACVDLVRRTTSASGVPFAVDDDATIDTVANVMRGGDRDARSAG